MADLTWVLGDKAVEGEALETEAFGIQRKVLGDDHPDVARSIYLLGDRMRRSGSLTESHAVLYAALSIQIRLLGEDHPDVLATLIGLAATLEKEGDWAGLEAVREGALFNYNMFAYLDGAFLLKAAEYLNKGGDPKKLRAFRFRNLFPRATAHKRGPEQR